MATELKGTKNDIEDDEWLRRYFFKEHYDPQQNEWSYNTFQLMDLNPPENYLSLTRVGISPDANAHAKHAFLPKKLKKLKGYTVLLVSDVRNIDIEKIKLKLLSDIHSIDGHAGLYTWHESKLVEGSVEYPEILELKKTLFELAIPTYQAFTIGAFDDAISNKTN